MPTYDYGCKRCKAIREEVRLMSERNDAGVCSCGGQTERVMLVAPAMTPWNSERKFPNLSKEGDGTMSFRSKTEYEGYLKENNIGEWGVVRPGLKHHKNKIVGRWNRAGERLSDDKNCSR